VAALARFFNVFSRNNYMPAPAILSDEYERPVFPSPPAPSGEWSLIVDENGDKVTTRPPLPTDMVARPPVQYHFGGTLPKYEPVRSGDRQGNLPGLLDYEIRAQVNKEYLDKAVFLLSQTDDGRRLLEKAWTNKFTFVFDPVRVGREGAAGLCDFNEKMIPLAEGRSPAEVALTLKHELQHMEDMANGAGYSTADTPKSARMMERAMEGNARVSESVAAAEVLLGSPRGPAQQFRTPSLFRNLWRKNNPMAEQAHAALGLAKQGKWKEFGAKVFPQYFRQTDTLDYYDKRYADFLLSATPDIASDQAKAEKGQYHERDEAKRRIAQAEARANAMFTGGKTAQDVAGTMLLRGQPYLDAAALESAPAQMVSPAADGTMARVKDNLERIIPGTDKTALLAAPPRTVQRPTEMPNPYRAFHSALSGYDTFEPIVMPNRLDGQTLTSGGKLNAEITQYMANEVRNMKSGRTDTDRLNYSITNYIQHRANTANLRGVVGDLLEAGLRAPVAAFSSEYLTDLYRRMYTASDVGSTGDRSPLSRQELKLIRHWQDMRDNGLDPIWISKENKAQSFVGDDREIAHYAEYLVKGLKPGQPQPGQPTAKKSQAL
jgi:hypothetical protein